MRDAVGEWWDGFCFDLLEEDGQMKYALRLDNGDTMKLPVEDITAVLEKQKKYKAGRCAVLPFRRSGKKKA